MLSVRFVMEIPSHQTSVFDWKNTLLNVHKIFEL